MPIRLVFNSGGVSTFIKGAARSMHHDYRPWSCPGTPHGLVMAVSLPQTPDPAPDEVLAVLHDEEVSYARALRSYRHVQFVGGRIALRAACVQLGVHPPALLPDDRGAPQMPPGYVGSIAHKRDLAVAIVARVPEGTLGIDLEAYGPPRMAIAPKVLTEPERAAVNTLPEAQRWRAVLLRFSIKEALYKALDPYVRRYVGFHEAQVYPDGVGAARVQFALAGGEGPFHVEARYNGFRGRMLTTVRLRLGRAC